MYQTKSYRTLDVQDELAWSDGRTCREAAFWRPKCLTLATNDTRIAT